MKALVVVADPATKRKIEDFFKRRLHAIFVCSQSEAARTAIAIHLFQFAIVDLEADPQAVPLIRSIREVSRDQTYIIALPRTETPTDLRAALEAGADDYIAPPMSVTALQLRLAIGERVLAGRVHRTSLSSVVDNSERRYRTLIETMHEGLFQIDENGVIEFANSRLSEITGFTLDELKGKVADEVLVSAEIRDRLPGRTLLGVGVGSEEYAIPLKSKDGRPIWVELTGAPVITADGRSASIGIVHDVTEQRNAEEGLRRKEDFFRAVLENSADLTSILERDGRIVYQSPSSLNILGQRPEATLGQSFPSLIPEEDLAAWNSAFEQVLAKAEARSTVQLRLKRDNAEPVYVEVVSRNLQHDPHVGGIVVTSRDVNERRKVEAALKRERAFFQQLFRNSPAAIAILDTADRVVDVNGAFVDLFQYEVQEIAGRPLSDFIVPEDLKEEATELSQLVFGAQPVDRETTRLRKDGSKVEVGILGFPIELADRRIGAFGIYSDITERKAVERKLFHDAFHDALTSLPNRTLLTERLERDIRRAKRRIDYQFALLFIDLDRFKWINDNLGHAAGDELLCEVARRLEGCLRPGDTTARLGGDEFVIILEDIKEVADATRIAERILESLALPFRLGQQETSTSGSIGIAFSATGYDRAEDLMRDADIAMYRAKSGGKGRYEIFDTEMQKSALERRELERDLARAVEQHELTLLYQPIVSLATGKMVGFEALLRWRHPSRGLLMPAELIPLCEDTGLIVAVGSYVVEESLRQLADWQKSFPESDAILVHVNLSAKEVNPNELLPMLDRVQKEHGVHPAGCIFEIPESVAATGGLQASDTLWQLRRRGYRLAINDIGLGNSSLGALQRLPLDMLKVDRSLVRAMEPGGDHVELVRAIGALGESFGLRVIATGIERPEQVDFLRELEIGFAQGFHFAAPVLAEEATRMLRENRGWTLAPRGDRSPPPPAKAAATPAPIKVNPPPVKAPPTGSPKPPLPKPPPPKAPPASGIKVPPVKAGPPNKS
jgi:diguanylate cyclase (GGDEF)-like protein/PAS domain S-box-containing protein